MWRDPIVDEVRSLREAYAGRFNYDLQAIARDLKAQERATEREPVRLKPRRLARLGTVQDDLDDLELHDADARTTARGTRDSGLGEV